MKKLLTIIFVVLGIVFFGFPVWGTDVGGIIDTDTTWDLAGSQYNIVDTVQIAEGFTLTIESGVIVNGNDKWIEVWGALVAVGLQDDYINPKFLNLCPKSWNELRYMV